MRRLRRACVTGPAVPRRCCRRRRGCCSTAMPAAIPRTCPGPRSTSASRSAPSPAASSPTWPTRPRCRALLDRAGVRFTALPRAPGRAAMRLSRRRPLHAPAARAHRLSARPISAPIARSPPRWRCGNGMSSSPPRAAISAGRSPAIDHFGSYSCRRLYGRDEGAWSEHARANAVDIAGFRLGDGTPDQRGRRLA